jgi:hypothetical protein
VKALPLLLLPEEGAPYEPGPDDETPPDPAQDDYPDWTADGSKIISGPLGPSSKFPGTRYHRMRDALEAVSAKHHVYRIWGIPGRWFARVKK